ncbi:MAG: hypothetical protein UHG91_01955 [Succinivibrionaceae bacterium]|nr:hypothetical protein [Ruminobacter sp.]MDY5778966.1 hypothetical protein [Succinivibrionaceae bacterium]MEE1339530.1 hypothetical protein [Succinivibrionaceae bacterium]
MSNSLGQMLLNEIDNLMKSLDSTFIYCPKDLEEFDEQDKQYKQFLESQERLTRQIKLYASSYADKNEALEILSKGMEYSKALDDIRKKMFKSLSSISKGSKGVNKYQNIKRGFF